MKRADVVIATAIGGLGKKPRPFIVIQSDAIISARIVLVGCTSSAPDEHPTIWPRLYPTATNGLDAVSDVMTDNLMTAYRKDVAKVVGWLSRDEMDEVDAALMLVLNLAAGR